MKYTRFLIGAGIFLVCLSLLFPKGDSGKQPIPNAQTLGITASFVVTQRIDYGGILPRMEQVITVTPGENVLDIVRRSKQVAVKEYSYGMLVESIDGVKNGTASKYWLYSVNGKESTVAAAEYIVKPSDRIEWKFKAYEK